MAAYFDESVEFTWWEDVEGIAVGEDQAADAAVVGVDGELAQCAAGVVADECDVGQVERGEECG